MSGNKNSARTARDTIVNGKGLLKLIHLMSTSELLKKIIECEEQELRRIRQELAVCETGRLRIHYTRGKYTFGCYQDSVEKEEGITRKKDRIHELARQSLLQDQEKMLTKQLKRLKTIAGSCEEVCQEKRLIEKLNKFADAGLDLSRIIFTGEQNEWIDQPYTPNPYHLENLIYATNGNMYMRSGAEKIIGNALEMYGLPYRYDDCVRIVQNHNGAQAYNRDLTPFRELYFADFKVPNFFGGITVHEHFGAFEIDQYGEGSLRRLNDYHNFTVVELPERPVRHEEFTWSFGHEIRDAEVIRKLLLKILLPGLT